MPRAKKEAAAATVPEAESSAVAAEKKPRKENQWNSFLKAEYAKYKGTDEHKSKSHSELTKMISEQYKKKKEQPAAAASESE